MRGVMSGVMREAAGMWGCLAPYGSIGARCHIMADGSPHVHEDHAASAEPHPGHRVIAVCGKGGVGKTAFSALLAHALMHRADTGRLLVIDADPALGLALAMGVEPARTIGSVRDALLEAATSGSAQAERDIAEKLDYLVFESLVETDHFAFLAMGRSRELGCYCSVNDLLRDSIEMLTGEFDTIVIDGEAGLEQINRQVAASIDDLIIVSDGSARSQRTVETIWDMARVNNVVAAGSIDLVLNRQAPGVPAAPLRDDVIPRYLGSIPDDGSLSVLDREGETLLHLHHDDPAFHAVRDICARLY